MMKKIMIIGCPGSGKSTFARALHEITNIPLYHLDMLYWNADKTFVDKETFRSRLSKVLGSDSFIVDGNFSSTMEMRLKVCDTVFFFDFPADICLAGVAARRGKKRPDIPWIETAEDPQFTEFIKSFNAERKPKILELLSNYKHINTVVFTTHGEASKYLEDLTKN